MPFLSGETPELTIFFVLAFAFARGVRKEGREDVTCFIQEEISDTAVLLRTAINLAPAFPMLSRFVSALAEAVTFSARRESEQQHQISQVRGEEEAKS